MRLLKKLSQFEGFDMDWRRLIAQGVITLLAGVFIGSISALSPDIMVFQIRGFSLLPVSGMFLLALGLLECLDAFVAKSQRDVVQNLQVGVLDTVVGALTILSISGNVSRLSMMISAFLIVRGLVRIIFVFSLKLPHKISTAIGGLVSVILGVLVFQEWPTAEGWFVSLCLSVEIAFRGWAGISFALWVKKQKAV
jgi:uncharacterized membrane protein HdeD (DUF308 family)